MAPYPSHGRRQRDAANHRYRPHDYFSRSLPYGAQVVRQVDKSRVELSAEDAFPALLRGRMRFHEIVVALVQIQSLLAHEEPHIEAGVRVLRIDRYLFSSKILHASDRIG